MLSIRRKSDNRESFKTVYDKILSFPTTYFTQSVVNHSLHNCCLKFAFIFHFFLHRLCCSTFYLFHLLYPVRTFCPHNKKFELCATSQYIYLYFYTYYGTYMNIPYLSPFIRTIYCLGTFNGWHFHKELIRPTYYLQYIYCNSDCFYFFIYNGTHMNISYLSPFPELFTVHCQWYSTVGIFF